QSLESISFYVYREIDQDTYDVLLTVIQSLPGIHSVDIEKLERKINCSYDKRDISAVKIQKALEDEKFAVIEYNLYKSLRTVSFTVKEGLDDVSFTEIETVIKALPGIHSVTAVMAENKVFCTYDNRDVKEDNILRWVSTEGYSITKD
ncbi:hypothetical protein ACFL96_18290, partial [Thermoproteota archaeon]